MKIMITERPENERAREIVKCLDITCPACNKKVYFKLSMLDYCSALYCAYCGNRFDADEIIKSVEKSLI
ncbi:MAG TPA: hypothetical protein ENL45_01670 [Candidatus Woesearchaeota archaeon]|nr:hypothetical protein [Candidatus Woesearchaeota archaeon]